MKLFSQQPKPFRVFDVVYFILALPLVLTVFHETIICPLVPALGIHGADDPNACTVGWYFFFLLPILGVWAVATLLSFIRVYGLLKLGREGRAMLILYAIAILAPALFVLYTLTLS